MICMGLRGNDIVSDEGITCKDCIHFDVCTEYNVAFWGYKSHLDSPIINATPDNCPFFSEKTS